MQLLAHATTFEFAAGIIVFLAGMCAGPWVVHIISTRKGKSFRDQ
jgi:hypothetical protein